MRSVLRDLYLEESRLALREEKDDAPATDDADTQDTVDTTSIDSQVQQLFADYENDASTSGSFNVETFATSVARLAENFSDLIETEHAVLSMAVSFLKKSHDDDTAKKLEALMRDEHSIATGKTKSEVRDDSSPAPTADRAGPNVG